MPTHAESAAATAALRQGSRSFAAAALLLPPRARRHATALYGFCREADDAIDSATPAALPQAMAALDHRLDRIYAGAPLDSATDRAFADVLHANAIPRALPEALLEGFRWDAEGRRYPDLPALRTYAARVAGAVGTMMALVLGATGPQALARAADLGVAMQLSNIARDIAEDAAAGRLYLPLDWLAAADIDPDAFLAHPTYTPALATVLAALTTEAERLYTRAEPGIALLPLTCRPAIRAAARLYREIGREVSRRGPAALATRTIVSPARKLALLPACLRPSFRIAPAPALPETAFLLHTIPRPIRAERESAAVWVLDLFTRLAERDQTAA